ncbi:MAG: hypothetical protein H7247_05695 [Polaromonas sp.]|nr:hypothetical protein [Gemmatimonadaceae bacterium]
MSYTEMLVEGKIVKVFEVIVNHRSVGEIGTTTQEYCLHYTQGGVYSPQAGVAQDATPPTVYAACAALGIFRRHASDPAPAKPVGADPAAQTIAIPSSVAKCAAVGKVAVRSTGVACTSARSVIARYAKSLKSPAGWSCSAAINDAGRRVKCTPKASKSRAAARKAVYGLWRS